MNLVHKMMFTVHHSELGFDETVTALKESAQKHGWDIPMVHDLQKTYQQAGCADMTRVTTLYFCDPQGGYSVLQHDAHKPMAVMMPIGVSVYETHDEQVHIAGMNLERMSMMFGGTVKEVLREGAARYERALADIAKPEPDEEIKVDSGRCCLGCASFAAVVAALAGVAVVIMIKVFSLIMPKMMAKMMPKMMAKMEEQGIQPPCAQIILEHLESQQGEEPFNA
jgi:uncharacterized protein (DUF302 family)